MPSPHLQRKLKEALGDDAGAEQAAVNDRIDPIRGDIAELRHVMEKGFASMDSRFTGLKTEMDSRFTTQKAETEAAIRTAVEGQTRFFFVAWGVLLAAIVGLYGTVVAFLR